MAAPFAIERFLDPERAGQAGPLDEPVVDVQVQFAPGTVLVGAERDGASAEENSVFIRPLNSCHALGR
ncbi:hypothetical protein ACYCAX_01645 [Pseudomonas sp. MT3]